MHHQNKLFLAKLVDDICNYIDYLAKDYGYMISLHRIEHYSSENWYRLLKYYYHQCPVCREVKSSMAAWTYCIDRQPKVLDRAAISPYIGTCWAGVTEYVFPLQDINGTTRGFLCLSGYTLNPAMSTDRACSMCSKYGLSREKLIEAVSRLNRDIPDFAEVSSRIQPLQSMFTTLFHFKAQEASVVESSSPRLAVYEQIIHYTNTHFRSTNFSLHDVCKHLNISYSYASHLFAEYNELPFSRYVRRMRIVSAKRYLEHTDLSVGLIASDVGFSDSNYFSSIFRAETGMTPSEYRHKFRLQNGGHQT